MSETSSPEHPKSDEALDWVLGLGTPAERDAFETSVAADPALESLVDALMEGAAILAMSVAPDAPRPELRATLLKRLQEPAPRNVSSFPVSRRESRRNPRRETMAWAAAAVFAVGCLWLWKSAETTDQQLVKANTEIERLIGELTATSQSRDLARIEVETLKATIDEYREGVALVVWDVERQEGVLKLEKMPAIPVGKDYQLWVVDPAHANPVDAGVVRVDDQGFARVRFKPSATVGSADKFAISVEQQGGVPVAQGPIVLLSQ